MLTACQCHVSQLAMLNPCKYVYAIHQQHFKQPMMACTLTECTADAWQCDAGTIPASWMQKQLHDLSLWNNMLSGVPSSGLWHSTLLSESLSVLDLSDNMFSSSSIPAAASMPSLTVLACSSCNWTGDPRPVLLALAAFQAQHVKLCSSSCSCDPSLPSMHVCKPLPLHCW